MYFLCVLILYMAMQVVQDLVNKVYAAPNQATFIKDIQEVSKPRRTIVLESSIYFLIVERFWLLTSDGWIQRSVDGKNYYTFEYNLTSPNFSVTRFTTIAIANGKSFFDLPALHSTFMH